MKRWLFWPILIILMGCQSSIQPTSVVPTSQISGQNFATQSPIPTPLESTATLSPNPVAVTRESTVIPSPIPFPVSTESTLTALPIPAFPGAEGFGANSVGGRGGRVIEVTNLSDSGPGTLRAAIEAEGPRIVVFRVAGTIELKTSLEIIHPYITIAGQTAPGGGVTLKGYPSNENIPLIVNTHDVIIRYLRSRPGPTEVISSHGGAIVVLGYDVMIDHCSFSWAIDQNVTTWAAAHDITFQWSIISEGLHCSTHEKGCHSMGMMLGSDGSRNITVHHNLFAQNHERNPYIKTGGVVDFVNNIIYDPGGTPSVVTDEYSKDPINYINNYFKAGADTPAGKFFISVDVLTGSGAEIFVQGNITPQRNKDNMPDSLAVKPDSRRWIVPDRHDAPPVTTVSAFDAFNQVLVDVGANMGLDDQGNKYSRQDSVDERIIADVKNNTGKLINDPAEVGGWPELAAGIPSTDSDHDGMPDTWEARYGFNPSNPADASRDADGDGYTNVEEYLNGTNPIKNP
jgi:pectate lyase